MFIRCILTGSIPVVFIAAVSSTLALAADTESARREVERALHLTPNLENGKQTYRVCAV